MHDRRALLGGISASAFGTVSFSALAPRLPPTTSRRSGPLRAPKRARRGAGCCRSRAHGIADPCAPCCSTLGKGGADTRSATRREHAVGHARDRVLLVQHQRLAEQRRHHAARESDVAAQAEHHVGLARGACTRDALPEGAEQAQRQQQPGLRRPLPRTPRERDQSRTRSRAAARAGFPCRRARPARCTSPAALAQCLGHRQPGKIWPPVPPAMIRAHVLLMRCPPRISTPVLVIDAQQHRERDAVHQDAPSRHSSSAAASGPWSAAAPRFTPMLMNAWKPIQMPMPCAASAGEHAVQRDRLPADVQNARATSQKNRRDHQRPRRRSRAPRRSRPAGSRCAPRAGSAASRRCAPRPTPKPSRRGRRRSANARAGSPCPARILGPRIEVSEDALAAPIRRARSSARRPIVSTTRSGRTCAR